MWKLRKPPRWARITLWTLLALFAVLFAYSGVMLSRAWVPLGKMATGERLLRMEASKHFSDGHFVDVMPRVEPSMMKILPKWFEEPHPYRRPKEPLSHKKITRAAFAIPPKTGLRITWLGHSTLIVEIEEKRILIDPVWGDYVAPLPVDQAKRFVAPPLPLSELPSIDAVVISHDHYDHLDYPTIAHLAKSPVPFYVPLGVGAHLEYWGVDEASIFEHEWWDESRLGDLTIACTPARHFSGRSLVDKDKTLWAGWAFVGKSARVFYSGDTALFPGFSDIGKRYGPFDVTMIESGAYSQLWADVHLGPEQAVRAHQMLRGGVLLPVHWGMFDLGLHGWTEPIERIVIAAERANVPLVTLMPGESFEPEDLPPFKRWWPKRPFDTAEEAPVASSGM